MYISENCNWTPYGTKSDLDKLVDSLISDTRISMVKQNYGLDKLINDTDRDVRAAVARNGYKLDILIDIFDNYNDIHKCNFVIPKEALALINIKF